MAKHTGGTFILRIEDTDRSRSEAHFEEDIFKSLKLLGLDWDEGPDSGGDYGPYRQSERLELYEEYAQKLLDQGLAYHCYLTQEELDAEKELAVAQKRPYVYSGKCRDPKVREELSQDPSRKPSIRFQMPDDVATIEFNDIVRGHLSFEANLIGDFVIMKSDGTPTYNFAVVIDDMTMAISHVVRGEDHISNTPRQLMLYQAFGQTPPAFAHVGMILAPDRSKLSKRHGATSVAEFIQSGYLPEAFCNFLALLGWSPPDMHEIGTLDHFATLFTLDRVVQSPAVFDKDKLDWLNGQYIRHMDLDALLVRCKPYLVDYDLSRYSNEKLLMMLDAVREPLTVLGDITNDVDYFFCDGLPPLTEEARPVFEDPATADILSQFHDNVVPEMPFDDLEGIQSSIKAFANHLKPIKTKSVMWAIRAALTGRVHGADLTKTLYILGQQTVSARIQAALKERLAPTH